MDPVFEDLMAPFRPQTVIAVDPTPGDYIAAGRLAGEQCAGRLSEYIAETGKSPSTTVFLTYFAAAMVASCDKMRETGATETNLNAWRRAYMASLSGWCDGWALRRAMPLG